MSILIKGMGMPKDYSVIVKIFPDGRVGTIPYVQWFKVDLISGTQAIPVPPHGRLGDLDAVEAEIREKTNEQFCVNIVHAAPTIIEAEE